MSQKDSSDRKIDFSMFPSKLEKALSIDDDQELSELVEQLIISAFCHLAPYNTQIGKLGIESMICKLDYVCWLTMANLESHIIKRKSLTPGAIEFLEELTSWSDELSFGCYYVKVLRMANNGIERSDSIKRQINCCRKSVSTTANSEVQSAEAEVA